ncbi:MAG: hypothetical protein KDC53_08350 [Saprospiraceae bacterium]|nr:hypothetical protein [Saprospiraceae bacterium]
MKYKDHRINPDSNLKPAFKKANTSSLPVLIDCPQCHSFISEEDLDKKNKLAKCNHCNHVFSYDDQDYWDPFGLPMVTQPEGLEVLRLPTFMEIKIDHYRTSRQSFWPLLLMTIFWNGILSIFIFNGLSSGNYTTLLFTSVHLLVGLFLIGNVLGTIFNHTDIYVDQQQICISIGPITLRQKRKCFAVENITQLLVKRTESVNTKGQRKISHSLLAKTNNGKTYTLLEYLDHKTLVFLEKEIEYYLKIEDMPQ